MKTIVSALMLGLMLALGACAPSAPGGGSPATVVLQAQLAYAIPLTAAVEYNNLPRCGRPTSPPLCSDQNAVEEMRKANVAARATLDAAERTVRDPAATADVKAMIATGAVNSVDAFKAIVALYGKRK